jgi:Periplasmic protease
LAEGLANGKSSNKQITFFKDNPVRYLSIANNGTLCFSYNGDLYVVENDAEAKKINIELFSDQLEQDVVKRIVTSGANDIAVSKDGKQVAFIYHGDVYVTSSEYKTTKQITNTPQQERDIDFSPDGRSIIYSSERNGIWQVYQTTIVNKDEKLFPYSTELKEDNLTNSSITSFQPLYSPDGKEVAFLENRSAIRVVNIASKKVRTVMDGKYQYSYSDGDQWYQWSPDGKWILTDYIAVGGWNNKDVALVDASGNGVIHNLTKSGYNDSNAKWVLDGKAMIWASDRAGYRSHGSWGAEYDVYIMFFDLEAYEKFRMNKEEISLLEESEKAEKAKLDSLNKASNKASKAVKGKKKENKSGNKETELKPLVFDLENCEDRIVRLTVNSSRLGDAILDKKGEKLYYLARFEKGMDLWVHDLKENTTKILIKNVGSGWLVADKEVKNIYINASGSLKKISVADGKITPIPYECFFDYKPYAEREYIFDHTWQEVKDKFYRADMGGVEWEKYRDNYKQFLPYISNNYDFTEMLSEMLGELNGSHTGARYRASGANMPNAVLGLFYDELYDGDGLKIKEIIKKSPLALIKSDVKPGCIIEKIDGQIIKAGEDYFPLLEGKVGKKVLLAIYDPSTQKRYNETIKAISIGEQNSLLYDRWVEKCRDQVEKLSGGRIGYIHIEGMDSPSFRVLYKELLGRYRDADAVVIDTRHNGGGWLHDDVITLLSGKQYTSYEPRGQFIGKDPFNKWTKPSCMLVCEDNYSNAHGTPWLYKTMNVGKLVGTPVPGTMTAVWWETQIDRSIVFGIPQVGCVDNNGNYLENQELEPDILIYNKPEDVLKGGDDQLKAAVKSLQTK